MPLKIPLIGKPETYELEQPKDWLRTVSSFNVSGLGTKVEEAASSVLRTSGATVPFAKISANSKTFSMARRAVELGYEEEFAQIVGLGRKPKLAKLMFDKVKAAMDADGEKTDAA